MNDARCAQVARLGACALALVCLLGPIACGRSGQAGAAGPNARPRDGQIDLTSPGSPSWPVLEPEANEPEPELTDADVEQIATRVPPVRVPSITAQNPSKGPATAKVTLQIFGDFQCPACVRAEPTLAKIEQRYRRQLRVVWRNFPLASHERARPAARASLQAFASGGSAQFWELHDWLYAGDADLSDAGLRKAAAALSLDPEQMGQAVSSQRYDAQIDADIAAGDAAGVEGTPAVFINNYYLIGVRHEAEYAVVIERALREQHVARSDRPAVAARKM